MNRAPNPAVLIVTTAFEPAVNSVIARFEKLGVSWYRYNVELYPMAIDATWEWGDHGGPSVEIRGPAGTVDTREITHVWARRVPAPLIPKGLSRPDRLYLENEVRAFHDALFESLSHAIWTNDRLAERRASSKLEQLKAARASGLRVPETLVTNERTRALAFAQSLWTDGREVAFKPLSGYSPRPDIFAREAAEVYGHDLRSEVELPEAQQSMGVVFTQKLSVERAEHFGSLFMCPVQFQEYIPKKSEFRVTVVEDRIFSCEILSQENPDTAVDFRRFVMSGSDARPPHRTAPLPTSVEESLRDLMKRLGLTFGCIDLVRTPDDQFVFLEVNPSGQWEWIELLTGMEITDAIAAHLSR